MKTVARLSELEDAYLARARLEGSGVRAFIPDEYTQAADGMYMNAIGGVRVQVADEDVPRVREILDLPPIDAGSLACPFCGSTNVRLRSFGAWTAIGRLLRFLPPPQPRTADCLACRRSFKVAPDTRSRRP